MELSNYRNDDRRCNRRNGPRDYTEPVSEAAKEAKLSIELKDKDQKIGDANKAAAEAFQRAANAELEAARANERAAELQKENLILQQKLANRRITEAQHDALVGLLSRRRGSIIIESMGDSESGLDAADFLRVFTAAPWAIAGTNFPLGVVWIGLLVYQSPGPDTFAVMQAFQAAAIPFSRATETRDRATIMVGGKPPMF